MRPYSVDFRQKIIDVWKKEKISIRGLAQRFDVAKSGSSLPFMLNQQTRCQDNILLTQKFRKFLKP
ncbi:hypothetical protein B1L04_03780 [Microcystis aeruginosa KW]|uniref:Transposase n=1 Tax=Microcystis aeruginosa KW TaxID=1960155 RepID=A0A1V4BV85_MICAE|nr:hypothetical protein B1L04_03780 [Microcystis aeruginosa KW]